MGKLELEAKDETAGILEEGGGILEEEDGQTERAFWVANFNVVLSGVLANA
jgi:hypothetical protein